MATSGTTAFAPSLGELVLYAFNLIQVRATSITQEHMVTSRMAANLVQLHWANRGVNLWKVDLQTVPLVQDVATYSVPADTICMLDAYVSNQSGVLAPTDRIILPVSRTEYASYPNKQMEGFPTVFWFDRLLAPTVTIWPVPGVGALPQFLNYYRCVQIQDAVLGSGTNVDMPPRFLPAMVDALAVELARSWAPTRVAELKMQATETYAMATDQDVETGNFYVTPILSHYFRP